MHTAQSHGSNGQYDFLHRVTFVVMHTALQKEDALVLHLTKYETTAMSLCTGHFHTGGFVEGQDAGILHLIRYLTQSRTEYNSELGGLVPEKVSKCFS